MVKGASRCCKFLLHRILGSLYHHPHNIEASVAEVLPLILSKAEEEANYHIIRLDLIHKQQDCNEAPLSHTWVE